MADLTDDDELPPRHLLEALTVPTLPTDFTDRVMDQLHPPQVYAPTPPSRWPWVIAAASTAIAAAAVASLVAQRPSTTIDREPATTTTAAPASSSLAVAAPVPPATGHVVLTLEPHDAQVRLDGALREGSSPVALTNLSLGRHALQVERVGFEPWAQSIDIPDDVLQLTVRLVPIPAKPELDVAAFVPQPAVTPTQRRHKKAVGGGGGSPDLKDPFGSPAPRSPASDSHAGEMKNPFATK